MEPLKVLVHSANPESARRIERALRTGAPGCEVEFAATFPAAEARSGDGMVLPRPEAPSGDVPLIHPELRHELNNHLALVRMLADFLAEDPTIPASAAAKAREIGNAADTAAQALRRTKQPPA